MSARAPKSHRQATNKGKRLEYVTIAWNAIEAVIAVSVGAITGSVSMIGFGVDGFIEAISGSALLWRMGVTHESPKRRKREKIALKIVSFCFLALAVYLCVDSILALVHKTKPDSSTVAIILACLSLIIMPWLTQLKWKVAKTLKSEAMHAEARQSQFSLYLSALLLAGSAANAAFGWWWADPICALGMVPLIAKEGLGNLTPNR
jgi:divalent metal cation (Fe/Co/Zn/Cd) transporter